MTNEPLIAACRELSDAGFFLLRTPLYPMDELLAWGDGLRSSEEWERGGPAALAAAWSRDVQLLRERLARVLESPEVIQALYVASPSLVSSLEYWREDPDSKRGRQTERALVRYFSRMCGRSTPFGLFSGCSLGDVESTSRPPAMRLAPRDRYQSSTRLDFDYLFSLTEGLRRKPEITEKLRYFPNSSLYGGATFRHYVESRQTRAGRTHHHVKVETDPYLEAVLSSAQHGITVAEAADVVRRVPGGLEVSADEAASYIQELLDSGLLVPSLAPQVTGAPALEDIIRQLQTIDADSGVTTALEWTDARLRELDRAGLGVPPEAYQAISQKLQTIPGAVNPAHLFQVDLSKPVESAVLPKTVVEELQRGVDILCRLGTKQEPDVLTDFRRAFLQRYERARVPLLEAIDEELGVGFGPPAMDSSPLLRGLRLGPSASGPTQGFTAAHVALIGALLEASREGRSEVELDAASLPSGESTAAVLPDSFSVNCTIAATSLEAIQRGDFDLCLQGAVGPDGARLLGRFCHMDAVLDEKVRELLRQEEMHDPESVFAEIVYLPEGRVGNVLCRPVLRDFEIVYLGRSGAPLDRQLPASDLLVGVEGDTITLYSKRLGRRVIPRLSNAHGFMRPTLAPVYRFLCFLQHQHGLHTPPSFSWGPLSNLDFLPRVRCGRVILAAARWQLSRTEIQALGKVEGAARFAAAQELRRRRKLPRWVVLEESDHTLPVDLENALSVDAMAHVLNRAPKAILREMCPAPDRLCVTGPEGSFHHELTVPLVRPLQVRGEMQRTPSAAVAHESRVGRNGRTFAPGGEWLYAKVYTGAATGDDVLCEALPPVIEDALRDGSADSWFFIRYADPQFHLRLRFHGDPARLRNDLQPRLAEALEPILEDGRIARIQFDTYDREVERYGGFDGIRASEECFFADSQACLRILRQIGGDEGLDLRWRVALAGVDSLLGDFGFDLERRFRLMERLRRAFEREFDLVAPHHKGLSDRFRDERRSLDSLLDTSGQDPFYRDAFARRSEQIAPAIWRFREIREAGELTVGIADLAASHIHMHLNRMLRSSPRAHELVIYTFLARLYEGRRARQHRTERVNA